MSVIMQKDDGAVEIGTLFLPVNTRRPCGRIRRNQLIASGGVEEEVLVVTAGVV